MGGAAGGRWTLALLGPLRPSPQMWTSARPAGAASTGSVPTLTAGTRACAPTASCWTHPAAAASVSRRAGGGWVPRPAVPSGLSQPIPGPLISFNTPRPSKTPRSLIRSASDFLDLLQPFLRTPFVSRSPAFLQLLPAPKPSTFPHQSFFKPRDPSRIVSFTPQTLLRPHTEFSGLRLLILPQAPSDLS